MNQQTDYHTTSAIGGAAGGILSFKLFFLQIVQHDTINIAVPMEIRQFIADAAFKLVGTVILAIVGSALAPLGRDFYKYKMKPHIFKNEDKKDKE